jgi:hypothetical protein
MTDDPRWPVFGPHKRHGGPKRSYTVVPRAALGEIGERLGWSKADKDRRIVYRAIWDAAGFHPCGCFPLSTTEIAGFYGMAERRVRSALNELDAEGILVWDGNRSIVYAPDVQVANVLNISVAQNGHEHLARLGPCEPVARCLADLGATTVGGTSDIRPQTSDFSCQTNAKGSVGERPTRKGSAAGDGLSCVSGSFEFWDDYELPLPRGYSREQCEEILSDLANHEAQVNLAVAVLLTAQREIGRDVDREDYAREQAASRAEPGRWLLMRVWTRLVEAEKTGKSNWLNAHACFHDGSKDRGLVETTDGLVWKEFGVNERPDSWRADA